MIWWQSAGLLLLGIVAAAADSPPEFTAAGLARGARPARMVVPGTFLTIYGSNLGSPPGTCAAAFPVFTWPRKFCGTQVLIADMPTELLYVSDKQINFKVPQDSPQGGIVDIRVVYDGRSSRPVWMKAGFERTTVSLDGPAYTDMPVWLKIDLPYEFAGAVRYPFILGPAGSGCNEVEVRRNGQMLPLLPGSNWTRNGIVNFGSICGSYSPASDTQADRLPLHLLYRLDVPGLYEVRYTLRSDPAGFAVAQTEFRARSEWTPIEVLAAKSGQRTEWLRSLRDRAPSDAAELLTDILPGLLGMPDDASFDILSGYLNHPLASVQKYALDGMSYWPDDYTLRKLQALLQTRGPSEAVTRYLARQGTLADGRR
jgi:hypothetical protein